MHREDYPFYSNPFSEDDNSNDNYPLDFTYNGVSLPNLREGSTSLQSIIFENFFGKKDENKPLNEFNNVNNFELEKKQDENINIIIEDNNSNDKPKKPRGRPPKNSSYINKKHTRYSPDNISKKAIRYCLKNLYKYLQKEIKSYAKSKKIRIRRLHVPTILKYLNKGNMEKCLLFDSSVKKIFIDMIPKRVKKEIENDRTKYSYNKEILNKILKVEEKDKFTKEKKLSIKLNCEFKIYFNAFLSGEKPYFIDENDENFNKLFKNLNNFYDEEYSNLSDQEKKEFEKYINKFMDRKIQFRKKRKNKNS